MGREKVAEGVAGERKEDKRRMQAARLCPSSANSWPQLALRRLDPSMCSWCPAAVVLQYLAS
jgi:hypothetical protein